jgi:hypothetical protein
MVSGGDSAEWVWRMLFLCGWLAVLHGVFVVRVMLVMQTVKSVVFYSYMYQFNILVFTGFTARYKIKIFSVCPNGILMCFV